MDSGVREVRWHRFQLFSAKLGSGTVSDKHGITLKSATTVIPKQIMKPCRYHTFVLPNSQTSCHEPQHPKMWGSQWRRSDPRPIKKVGRSAPHPWNTPGLAGPRFKHRACFPTGNAVVNVEEVFLLSSESTGQCAKIVLATMFQDNSVPGPISTS